MADPNSDAEMEENEENVPLPARQPAESEVAISVDELRANHIDVRSAPIPSNPLECASLFQLWKSDSDNFFKIPHQSRRFVLALAHHFLVEVFKDSSSAGRKNPMLVRLRDDYHFWYEEHDSAVVSTQGWTQDPAEEAEAAYVPRKVAPGDWCFAEIPDEKIARKANLLGGPWRKYLKTPTKSRNTEGEGEASASSAPKSKKEKQKRTRKEPKALQQESGQAEQQEQEIADREDGQDGGERPEPAPESAVQEARSENDRQTTTGVSAADLDPTDSDHGSPQDTRPPAESDRWVQLAPDRPDIQAPAPSTEASRGKRSKKKATEIEPPEFMEDVDAKTIGKKREWKQAPMPDTPTDHDVLRRALRKGTRGNTLHFVAPDLVSRRGLLYKPAQYLLLEKDNEGNPYIHPWDGLIDRTKTNEKYLEHPGMFTAHNKGRNRQRAPNKMLQGRDEGGQFAEATRQMSIMGQQQAIRGLVESQQFNPGNDIKRKDSRREHQLRLEQEMTRVLTNSRVDEENIRKLMKAAIDEAYKERDEANQALDQMSIELMDERFARQKAERELETERRDNEFLRKEIASRADVLLPQNQDPAEVRMLSHQIHEQATTVHSLEQELQRMHIQSAEKDIQIRRLKLTDEIFNPLDDMDYLLEQGGASPGTGTAVGTSFDQHDFQPSDADEESGGVSLTTPQRSGAEETFYHRERPGRDDEDVSMISTNRLRETAAGQQEDDDVSMLSARRTQVSPVMEKRMAGVSKPLIGGFAEDSGEEEG